ncbi:glycosyltransferase family 39 protein [Clostridium kluyveri]|uniref:Dolichyl-phosphate-mannose--protein mannosyltransferase n=1 Tax=Clostridium kluyveri TaxID=1534 RepID=A0A1L5F6W1_CLOKL|nr:glycosyltransferase family 39 protein [Clostridium kluyveri]APM38727.1 dolichyl-phosphate-mannose--protein mannosyltransferase [Clostridium kluyveri]UZQ51044.1 glycosyltransferase family 39 protein [Clostridium kluyveri]
MNGMKLANKIRFTKENVALILIVALSSILNFVNLSIEGYGNSYYAAAVKSMTMSFKNFFFVSFDPAGFVSIDKPPLGFWIQAIFAKIFGFSGVSIILPQALAGVISVILIYVIVKRAFGSLAGLISALCLAVTPVFVAASRNNTIDNMLVMVLLFACLALSIAAEKGKFKYLIISMVLVGVGFNVKMLQAYMVVPALYITYLLAANVSVKKRVIHLVVSTFVLVAVSLSWALAVDSISAANRPYVDSSTNNTVMELIVGHNGTERLSLSSSSKGMGGGASGGKGQTPPQFKENSKANEGTSSYSKTSDYNSTEFSGQFPGNPSGNGKNMEGGAGGQGPGGGNTQGGVQSSTFGGQASQGITRLFSKNTLSDQICWFIPLAIFGFIASAIKEKLRFRLDNNRKQGLALWFMWFLPVFIYFSFNTGTFHSYYLTMLAPPVAALAGIGITSMWEFYKERGWKSWLLPGALLVNGGIQLLVASYFNSYSGIVKALMILIAVLCIIPSIILGVLNILKGKKTYEQDKMLRMKKILVGVSIIGLLITPLTGSSQVLFNKLNGSFPAAGLELLSSNQQSGSGQQGNSGGSPQDNMNNSNSKLIEFLLKNKTNEKYLLVVSSSSDAADMIISTGESVMSLGGFMGNNKAITLDEFKELVKNGEVRYVMAGGSGGSNSSSEIMNWVKENGKVVSSSEYSNSSESTTESSNSTQNDTSSKNQQGMGGRDSQKQLYDLKEYRDSL